MHLCNTKYNSYRLVFVNAQHNVDLYIKLRLLIKQEQFSQQLTIREENNINSGTWSPQRQKRKQVKFSLCNVSLTNDANLSCFFTWFRCVDAPLCGAFNRSLGPWAGEISHLLTLGKSLNSRSVAGSGGRGFN